MTCYEHCLKNVVTFPLKYKEAQVWCIETCNLSYDVEKCWCFTKNDYMISLWGDGCIDYSWVKVTYCFPLKNDYHQTRPSIKRPLLSFGKKKKKRLGRSTEGPGPLSQTMTQLLCLKYYMYFNIRFFTESQIRTK